MQDQNKPTFSVDYKCRMDGGLNLQRGLRSRHQHDIEEGYQQDEGASSDDDIYGDHSLKKSRFGRIVNSCVSRAPRRDRIMPCERRCCQSLPTSKRTYGGYNHCPRMNCLYSFCNLMLSRYSTASLSKDKDSPLSWRTIATDEETPDTLSGSSVVVPAPPKLVDFSKCRATLPDVSPIEIPFVGSQGLNDNNDGSSSASEDPFPYEEFHEDFVHFYLRVPQSKLRKREQASTISPTSPSPRPQFTKMSRRGSNSSDCTDITPRNNYVAPFPRPISRDNSNENIAGTLSPHAATGQKQRFNRKEKYNSRKSEAGTFLGEEILIPLNDEVEDLHTEANPRQAYSDEDLDMGKPRRVRTKRRSSFVAGSKIERFDPNETDGRAQHRRRSQRQAGANDAESYAEWKIDLMVKG